MPSKRFLNKVCVYCATNAAAVGDHVFAREFFTLQHRASLPKVPACTRCNTEKSKVEHYLTTVLPFAGSHRQAKETLSEFVPPRLAKNKALRRELHLGMREVLVSDGHQMEKTLMLPLKVGALEAWARFVVRGLLWHHWKTILPDGGDVEIHYLSQAGERYFEEHIFFRPAARRIIETLGEGTFRYTGIQIPDNPLLSVWVIELYGGAVMAGDETGPNNVSRYIGAFTGPKGSMEQLLAAGGDPA